MLARTNVERVIVDPHDSLASLSRHMAEVNSEVNSDAK
jgi:hypothetical protein